MKTIILTLGDLSCQHCVKSVQSALNAIEGVERAEVSLDKAIVVGNVDAQRLINAIVEAGYQASLSQDSAK